MARTTKELRALQDEVAALAERLETLAMSAQDDAEESAQSTLDSAKEYLGTLRESTSERAARMKAMAREKAHVADEYAHEKPWQVAGTALALGALIGYLMSGRQAGR